MHCHGLPDRQNVHRCILIAVMGRAALWARSFPQAQRQLFNYLFALRTGLKGGTTGLP